MVCTGLFVVVIFTKKKYKMPKIKEKTLKLKSAKSYTYKKHVGFWHGGGMSNEKEVCCAAGYSRAMCFGCTADLCCKTGNSSIYYV